MARRPIDERGKLLAIRCLRVLERVLPVGVLCVVCWPWAAVQAACRLIFAGPTIRQFDRLPNAWRPPLGRAAWVVYLWRELWRVNLARLLCCWPDRLGERRWAGHCRCVGLERLEREYARGRPVALATLHFGPLAALCHWLRGRGMEAAILRAWQTERPLHWRFIDRLTDRGDRAFGPAAYDLSDLRAAYEHLRSGRILVMAVEGRPIRRVRVDRAGFALEDARASCGWRRGRARSSCPA
jgi:hypothetical protein